MRTALFSFFFIVGITATAHARLGENADELVARYGQPLSENDQKSQGDKVAVSYVNFQKGGFNVKVTISDGVSVQEKFNKIKGDALTIAEVRTLLNANAQGYGWESPRTSQSQKRWMRDDGAVAELAGGVLTITSKVIIAKEVAAKKLETKPSLDGF